MGPNKLCKIQTSHALYQARTCLHSQPISYSSREKCKLYAVEVGVAGDSARSTVVILMISGYFVEIGWFLIINLYGSARSANSAVLESIQWYPTVPKSRQALSPGIEAQCYTSWNNGSHDSWQSCLGISHQAASSAATYCRLSIQSCLKIASQAVSSAATYCRLSQYNAMRRRLREQQFAL